MLISPCLTVAILPFPPLDLSLYFRSNSEFSKFRRAIYRLEKGDYSGDFKLYLTIRLIEANLRVFHDVAYFQRLPACRVENGQFYREQVSFNILRSRFGI